MAVSKNKVIEGKFKGKGLFAKRNRAYIIIKLPPSAPLFGTQKYVFLDSNTVEWYQRVSGSFGSNIVLIIFKDGNKSLIDIDERIYEALKSGCMYNIKFDDNINDYYGFDIHKEIKCPHCKNVAYGAVGEKCPFCRRLYSMPAKNWRIRDWIGVPLLLIFYPAGLIWMWVNRSYYLKSRIYITIACAIFTLLGFWMGAFEV